MIARLRKMSAACILCLNKTYITNLCSVPCHLTTHFQTINLATFDGFSYLFLIDFLGTQKYIRKRRNKQTSYRSTIKDQTLRMYGTLSKIR
jgi:hypothetical protein